MASEIELKPCPFCGGEAVLDIIEDRGLAHVYCHDCYAESPVVICEACLGKAESEAIAAWNKRVAVAESATTTPPADASPRPWFVNGHSIEANDKSLWLQNEKTGRGVVANLPSAPKWRFKKDERTKMDALTAANANLIVDAVNSRVAVSKAETSTGDVAKCRALLMRLRDAYREDEDGVPYFDGARVPNLKAEIESALAAPPEPQGNNAKMREALEKCANWGEQIDCQLGSSDETVYAFRHERCLAHNISECARAALAAPARNCDVGTAEEQLTRLHKLCDTDFCKHPWDCDLCAMLWAQMPYEKGATDGDK